MTELLQSTAFGAALIFGFRHGFDWDHIAALTDLTGSQTTSRRSMWLATLYALGHAAMVLVLGTAAILFAAQVPEPVDLVMERFVGATLIGLGRLDGVDDGDHQRRTASAQSMDVADRRRATASLDRRRGAGEVVVIEHSHPHDHEQPMHEHEHLHGELAEPEHRHTQLDTVVEHRARAPSRGGHARRPVPSVQRPLGGRRRPAARRRRRDTDPGPRLRGGRQRERPADEHRSPRAASSWGSSCRTPSSRRRAPSGCAGCSAHRYVGLGLAVVTATFSLVVGSLLLSGHSAALPPILGG